MSLSYWFWFATIYLIMLTWQDYRNNRKVDDRRNYLMLGLTISIISHVTTAWWYKLLVTLVILILNRYMAKMAVLGGADINTLSWIILGFAYIDWSLALFFYAVFSVLTIVFWLLKQFVFKRYAPTQFYGVILTAFVLCSVVLRGYS